LDKDLAENKTAAHSMNRWFGKQNALNAMHFVVETQERRS
jgi:hypothetical protein